LHQPKGEEDKQQEEKALLVSQMAWLTPKIKGKSKIHIFLSFTSKGGINKSPVPRIS
jgi:hypothetical protein